MASERSDGLGLERLFGSLGAGFEEPVLLWRARGGTLACDTVTGARVAWVSFIYSDVLPVWSVDRVMCAYGVWIAGVDAVAHVRGQATEGSEVMTG